MSGKTIMSGKLVLTMLVAACLTTLGCNGKKEEKQEDKKAEATITQPTDSIAVIDLNRVALEIGAKARMDILMKKKESELVAQLNGLKTELGLDNDDLNSQKQGPANDLATKNSATLNLKAQAAQTQLAVHHADLKKQLLSQIRPVAYNVAQERGMQIVMTVGQVYAAGPEANITDEVIKRINKVNAEAEENAKNERPVASVAALPGGGDFMPR